MEDIEVSDASQLPVPVAGLNVAHVFVNHFGGDGDIYIEIQHSRRKVVLMWFWETFEDQENHSHQLNQLLQAVNSYFGNKSSFFPTIIILVLSQTHTAFRSRMWEFCFPPILQENEPTGL